MPCLLVANQVPVICSGTEGVFELAAVRVRCGCRACSAPGADPYFTPTQWEQHSGAGAAKKWKVSIRVVPGGVPDVPEEANAMMLGRWLESNGLDVRPGGKLTSERGCPPGWLRACLAASPCACTSANTPRLLFGQQGPHVSVCWVLCTVKHHPGASCAGCCCWSHAPWFAL